MKMMVRAFNASLAQRHRARIVGFALGMVGLMIFSPGVWTQVPPAGVVVGSTPFESLRNAATATRNQAGVVETTAQGWARNASSPYYRNDLFLSDFRTMQLEFNALHQRFNWMGDLALQTGRPYAQNTLAELEAGLKIIAEQLGFMQQQYASGNLTQAALVRACQTCQSLMGEWQEQLRLGCSRMGLF